MKIDKTSKYFIISLHALGVIIVSILFLMILQNITFFKNYFGGLMGLAMPFVYGFVIAYLLNPCMIFMERKVFANSGKNHPFVKRGLSIFVSYIMAGVIISIFFSIVVPQVITSLYGLLTTASDYFGTATLWINNNVEDYLSQMPFTQAQINEFIGILKNSLYSFIDTLKGFIPQIYTYTMAITAVFKNLVLGVIISIYMLISKEKFAAEIKKTVYAILSKTKGDKTVSLFRYINSTFSGFIYAKVLDSFIIGIMCFIGMTVLRIPYAMLISLIVGVTNVVPYFGPFIGAIPSVVILMFDDPMKALVFAIFILALQQFDGNILGPKLLGDSIGLSAFWVIFAVIVMGGMFGALGMFIGVPVFAIIYTLTKTLIEIKLEEKNLPIKTEEYFGPKE